MKLAGKFSRAGSGRPEEGLPNSVRDALNRFASSVNKSTVPSHPNDIELWCVFLGLLHATGSTIGEERLSAFLKKKKFPDNVIQELLGQHEMAMALLPTYDMILEVRAEEIIQ